MFRKRSSKLDKAVVRISCNRKATICLLVMLSLIAMLCGCSQQVNDEIPTRLRIAALPDQATESLESKHASLVEYLSDTLGVPCELIIPDSYEDMVDLITSGETDIALVGAYTYVLAKNKSDVSLLVSRDRDRYFTSVFIASPGNSVTSLEEATGLCIAFGSELSTSGHIMPRYHLSELGINAEEHFSEVVYSGAHDKTIELVLSGEADIGAVNSLVFDSLIFSDESNLTDAVIIAETLPYINYAWIAREGISEDFRKIIRSAFMSLTNQDAKHQAVLSDQDANGYLPILDEDFENIRHAIEQNTGITPKEKSE